MLAIALTVTLLGVAISAIVQQVRRDGDKIIAALRGESWIATSPIPQHAVMVRVSQRYPANQPMRAQPTVTLAEWRAAA